MGQTVQYASAQIKADSRGPLIRMPIVSCKPFLKNTRLVLQGNPGSCIPYGKYRIWAWFQIDGNTALPRIFHCIGKNLFHHEHQPLLIRQYLTV